MNNKDEDIWLIEDKDDDEFEVESEQSEIENEHWDVYDFTVNINKNK
jgi:hypothetical protein